MIKLFTSKQNAFGILVLWIRALATRQAMQKCLNHAHLPVSPHRGSMSNSNSHANATRACKTKKNVQHKIYRQAKTDSEHHFGGGGGGELWHFLKLLTILFFFWLKCQKLFCLIFLNFAKGPVFSLRICYCGQGTKERWGVILIFYVSKFIEQLDFLVFPGKPSINKIKVSKAYDWDFENFFKSSIVLVLLSWWHLSSFRIELWVNNVVKIGPPNSSFIIIRFSDFRKNFSFPRIYWICFYVNVIINKIVIFLNLWNYFWILFLFFPQVFILLIICTRRQA